jgi:hypothetical protein
MLEVIGVDRDPDSEAQLVPALELDGEQGSDKRADVWNLLKCGYSWASYVRAYGDVGHHGWAAVVVPARASAASKGDLGMFTARPV